MAQQDAGKIVDADVERDVEKDAPVASADAAVATPAGRTIAVIDGN